MSRLGGLGAVTGVFAGCATLTLLLSATPTLMRMTNLGSSMGGSLSIPQGDTWTEAMSRFSGSALVWISVVNQGYLPYAHHFIGNLQALGLADRFPLIIACIGDAALRDLRPLWPHVVKMDIEGEVAAGLEVFRTASYLRVVFKKLDAMRDVLSLAAASNVGAVGYLDFDVTLRTDPTPLVVAELEANPASPVVAQCDEESHNCANPESCPVMCSGMYKGRVGQVGRALNIARACPWPAGVYALRASEAAALLPILAYDDSDVRDGDQDHLQRGFNAANIKVRSLDRARFPNGWMAGFRVGETIVPREDIVPRDDALVGEAAVVHFNFLVTTTKEMTMRAWEMWFGDPCDRREEPVSWFAGLRGTLRGRSARPAGSPTGNCYASS